MGVHFETLALRCALHQGAGRRASLALGGRRLWQRRPRWRHLLIGGAVTAARADG